MRADLDEIDRDHQTALLIERRAAFLMFWGAVAFVVLVALWN